MHTLLPSLPRPSLPQQHFRSLMFLVDRSTRPKAAAVAAAGELPQQGVGQDGTPPSLGNAHERTGGVAGKKQA